MEDSPIEEASPPDSILTSNQTENNGGEETKAFNQSSKLDLEEAQENEIERKGGTILGTIGQFILGRFYMVQEDTPKTQEIEKSEDEKEVVSDSSPKMTVEGSENSILFANETLGDNENEKEDKLNLQRSQTGALKEDVSDFEKVKTIGKSETSYAELSHFHVFSILVWSIRGFSNFELRKLQCAKCYDTWQCNTKCRNTLVPFHSKTPFVGVELSQQF